MELKDFVQASLIQIAKGIEGAAADLSGTTAQINPKNVYVNSEQRQNYGRLMSSKEYAPIVELVEFDVSVHASEGTERSGGVGISIGSVGIGVGGKENENTKSESRIRFKVPVVWPTGTRA